MRGCRQPVTLYDIASYKTLLLLPLSWIPTLLRFMKLMSSSPPPHPATSHLSSSMGLPIAAIAILGILTTSIFLLTYYVFVIKCCLNRRRSDFLLHLFPASLRRSFPSPSPAESTGLDPFAVRAIPTFRYSVSTSSAAASECAVCLSEFGDGEWLRLLPVCAHAFHVDCVDTWLQSNTSCPLCRAHITASSPPPPADHRAIPTQNSVTELGHMSPGNPRRKLGHALSMGDESIEERKEKDESFALQSSLRRSLSMDSSCHRQLYISVQEILRRNPNMLSGEGSSNGGGGGEGGDREVGRARRSFFPFGYGRSWRSAIRPVDMDV